MEDAKMATEKQSQVANQLALLETQIVRIREVYHEFNVQLGSVLREQVTEQCEDEKVVQELVPLATQLREYVSDLSDITSSYQKMLSQIEL